MNALKHCATGRTDRKFLPKVPHSSKEMAIGFGKPFIARAALISAAVTVIFSSKSMALCPMNV